VIVVAGAGLAGLQTVVALRGQGYQGLLTLVGAEAEPPYDRPPLTKEVMLGRTDSSTLDADWAALGVDVRLGTRVLEVGDGVARTDAGDLEYDSLVLATGARPRVLAGADGALTLRTHADALALRDLLRPGFRLLVVGAGWIGAEVATAAVERGAAVTVVDGAPTVLATALPSEVGERMLPWWRQVDVRLGSPAVEIGARSAVLADGTTLEADAVLMAVGAVPTAVAGVEMTGEGAVAVDEHLRTSLPGVLAVGDCAAWSSRRYGTRMLVEHWDNALHSPTVAAANVLGGDEVWDPVPYFWSEQWGRMVQYAGRHDDADSVVWRDEGERWAAFWLAGERLVAALAVDRPRDLVQARKLMERDLPVDASRLADPAVAVRDSTR
jgi:NADPH-dependent 2,4-dienoyl-CoA reductase/sulfur reductase-like enzyme